MRRLIWMLVGAVSATLGLLASPEAYARLRAQLFGGEPAESLEPPEVGVADVPEQVVTDADGPIEDTLEDADSDDYAEEIRNRIEEARARVRERATQARAGAEPTA